MPTLTLIMGLCGSGKSCLADRHAAPVNQIHEGFYLEDRHESYLKRLRDVLRAGQDAVVTETAFCDTETRERFVEEFTRSVRDVADFRVNRIFFANDSAAAKMNILRRAALQIQRNQFLNYDIPEDVTPLPVWRGEE